MFPGDLIYKQADNEDQLTHTMIAKLGGSSCSVPRWEYLVSDWVGSFGHLLGGNSWSVTRCEYLVSY